MQWWVNVSMETQTAISCRHVSAPDRPEAGRRLLPSERGPVTIQVVQDLMRGPGLLGGPDSSGCPEPQLLALERLPLPGHVATPDLPQSWNGSGPWSGEQDFGPQGSGCLDVDRDNYKGTCLDTARGGTPVLGYRQWPPGPPRERYEPAGGATTVMCLYAT